MANGTANFSVTQQSTIGTTSQMDTFGATLGAKKELINVIDRLVDGMARASQNPDEDVFINVRGRQVQVNSPVGMAVISTEIQLLSERSNFIDQVMGFVRNIEKGIQNIASN